MDVETSKAYIYYISIYQHILNIYQNIEKNRNLRIHLWNDLLVRNINELQDT